MAWLAYRQQYGAAAYISDHVNKRYRHIAYRQLARFLFGIVGRENRAPLPSCAVKRIRETFPSTDGEYTGYQEILLATYCNILYYFCNICNFVCCMYVSISKILTETFIIIKFNL